MKLTFSQRLKKYRKKIGSQKDLSAKSGIPQTTLSNWEIGRSEPTVTEIVKLAFALGVSFEDLLTDQEDEQAATMDKAG